MDDIAVAYSLSSSTVYDSIAATGRVPTDARGQMEAETCWWLAPARREGITVRETIPAWQLTLTAVLSGMHRPGRSRVTVHP